MRYLVLSDIHGNWEGLEAVLKHADGLYDEILCGGDLVGYCADPNPVVDWIRSNVKVVIRGNHDKVCAGVESFEWFNPMAQAAALWTQQQLTDESLEYLRNLPKGPARIAGFQLLHGSPADEDEYLINSSDIAQITAYVDCPLSFFGHTHMQGGFFWGPNGVHRINKTPDDCEQWIVEVDDDTFYLANPGSVGQPRDNDPRAAYLIYDDAERALAYRRTPYDIRTAQEKIRRAGLPDLLARRLDRGA